MNKRISQRISTMNKKRIINFFIENIDVSLSKAYISQSLQISFPSVSSAVSKLIKEGFIKECNEKPYGEKNYGRKPKSLCVNDHYGLIASVQIGYENLRIVLMDAKGRKVEGTTKFFNRFSSFESIIKKSIKSINELIKSIEKKNTGGFKHFLGVSISIPAPISETKEEIIYSRYYNWEGEKLPRNFIIQKNIVKVFYENDANLMALGAGKVLKVHNLIAFYLGFGIGAGLVINGSLYRGSNGLAGEIGQLLIHKRKSLKELEGYILDTLFSKKLAKSCKLKGKFRTHLKLLKKIEKCHDEQNVKEILIEVTKRISPYLSALIVAFDPQVVVFEGEIVNHVPSLFKLIKEHVSAMTQKSLDFFKEPSNDIDFIAHGSYWQVISDWFEIGTIGEIERGVE